MLKIISIKENVFLRERWEFYLNVHIRIMSTVPMKKHKELLEYVYCTVIQSHMTLVTLRLCVYGKETLLNRNRLM